MKNLLNQTSGFTKRHSDAPRGEGTDMLRKTVEPFIGAALDFAPGTSYAYSNINYNILGLIIEAAIYGGMKPAGFIISSSYDMARWMGLHL